MNRRIYLDVEEAMPAATKAVALAIGGQGLLMQAAMSEGKASRRQRALSASLVQEARDCLTGLLAMLDEMEKTTAATLRGQ